VEPDVEGCDRGADRVVDAEVVGVEGVDREQVAVRTVPLGRRGTAECLRAEVVDDMEGTLWQGSATLGTSVLCELRDVGRDADDGPEPRSRSGAVSGCRR
jgi:hypothetical protein